MGNYTSSLENKDIQSIMRQEHQIFNRMFITRGNGTTLIDAASETKSKSYEVEVVVV